MIENFDNILNIQFWKLDVSSFQNILLLFDRYFRSISMVFNVNIPAFDSVSNIKSFNSLTFQ